MLVVPLVPVSVEGTTISGAVVPPPQQTVSRPVFVIAQVWSLPADTAATWPRVEGTVD
jgi:hypothetical protein